MNREHYIQEQIEELVIGLKEKLDISYYANPFFDWYQMREIRLGLEHHIDVSRYANEKIDYFTMRQIRKGKEAGIDLFPLYLEGYPASVLRQIRKAHKKRIDLIPYAKKNYDYMQLEQILFCLEEQCKIDDYLKLELSGAQLSEIRLGLEHRVDVSRYADKGYTWMQMQEIRLGLEQGLDITWYQDKYFGHMEMQEIRLGLEQRLDVANYAKLSYCYSDMRNLRLFMLQNPGETSSSNRTDAFFNAIRNQNQTEIEELDQVGVMTRISEDEMRAYIRIVPSEEHPLTVQKIASQLKDEGIILGVDTKAIEEALERHQYQEWIPVAEGKQSMDGKDGYYEYSFDIDGKPRPTILEDGSVDYNHLQDDSFVKEGQLLAKYHQPTNGIYGYHVTGSMIIPEKGKDASLIAGECVRKEDQDFYAVAQGRACKDNNTLSVSTIYQYDGDYTQAMGYLQFQGDVHIKGNVESGVRIKAAGNIIIDENVADAFLESEGDILIKRGVSAKGGGMIKAKGKISSRFFENAKVYAEKSIEVNYILNSDVVCLDEIVVSGRKGFIIGGWTQALNRISTYNLGNNAYMETRVELGIGKAVRDYIINLNNDIQNCENEIDYYKQKMKDMERAYSQEELSHFPMYRKVQELIEVKNTTILDIQNRIQFIRDENQKLLGKPQLIVRQHLYPNVCIVVNSKIMKTRDESGAQSFSLTENQIVSA